MGALISSATVRGKDPVYFTNTVQPGDSMSASVSVSGSTYTITLTDNTRGWTQTENETGSGLSDSSAEVITEAPSTVSGPLPLADFGTVNYADSTANGESMDSLSPTAIKMAGASGDQLDSTSGMDSSPEAHEPPGPHGLVRGAYCGP